MDGRLRVRRKENGTCCYCLREEGKAFSLGDRTPLLRNHTRSTSSGGEFLFRVHVCDFSAPLTRYLSCDAKTVQPYLTSIPLAPKIQLTSVLTGLVVVCVNVVCYQILMGLRPKRLESCSIRFSTRACEFQALWSGSSPSALRLWAPLSNRVCVSSIPLG